MAAEEGQKKRTKRKGLGGLTPEKKKKLKVYTIKSFTQNYVLFGIPEKYSVEV